MYEMKKPGRYGIGFIDPNTVSEYTWKLEWCRQDVEKCMHQQKTGLWSQGNIHISPGSVMNRD